MGSIRRRLEVLEGQTTAPETPDISEARAKMKAHLDQIARHRRSELGPEETAEVEALTAAFTEAFERERARRRGEGGR